ncbi:hypothetical protein HPB49_003309 [Dermacentor silvarum]|uniref:Uncharacterized protein n=1 Tax=Dermacentor silvarum TaxID=543639 RepID=A0ACB8DAL0_DERSI|nr:hypothetical protein HPB49_003309 [Dermacentor silvarum]
MCGLCGTPRHGLGAVPAALQEDPSSSKEEEIRYQEIRQGAATTSEMERTLAGATDTINLTIRISAKPDGAGADSDALRVVSDRLKAAGNEIKQFHCHILNPFAARLIAGATMGGRREAGEKLILYNFVVAKWATSVALADDGARELNGALCAVSKRLQTMTDAFASVVGQSTLSLQAPTILPDFYGFQEDPVTWGCSGNVAIVTSIALTDDASVENGSCAAGPHGTESEPSEGGQPLGTEGPEDAQSDAHGAQLSGGRMTLVAVAEPIADRWCRRVLEEQEQCSPELDGMVRRRGVRREEDQALWWPRHES